MYALFRVRAEQMSSHPGPRAISLDLTFLIFSSLYSGGDKLYLLLLQARNQLRVMAAVGVLANLHSPALELLPG